MGKPYWRYVGVIIWKLLTNDVMCGGMCGGMCHGIMCGDMCDVMCLLREQVS